MNLETIKRYSEENKNKTFEELIEERKKTLKELPNNQFTYKETKKKKVMNFLINTLIMIVFAIIVYLGSPSNPAGARYEGAARAAAHR